MRSHYRSLPRLFILPILLSVLFSPLYPAVQAAPLVAPNSTPPIILLHGIMGARLDNSPGWSWWCLTRPRGEIWLNLIGLINPISYNERFKSLYLRDDGLTPQNTCDSIRPNSVIMFAYQPIVDALTSAGYQVYPYAYDWRLDIDVTVNRLEAYIKGLGVDKVILLSHSMGGLVARRYTADASRAQRIDRVITVGTPFWGAPVLAKHMRDGTVSWPLDIVVDNEIVRTAVRNFPGAMQILPSDAYFNQYEGYFIYQNTFLSTYASTLNFFAAHGQNTALISAARTWHQTIDDFRTGTNVPFYALAGSHLPTVSRVREYTCWWFFTCYDESGYAAGDGTVPWASARMDGRLGDWSGDAQVCNYPPGSLTSDHGEMINDPLVLQDIFNLINRRDPVNCQFTNVLETTASTLTAAPEPFTQLRITGPVRLTLIDAAGNISGFDPNGKIVNNIPNVTLDISSHQTFATFPTVGEYQAAIHSESEHAPQVYITQFALDETLTNFVPVTQAAFLALSFNSGDMATLDITPVKDLSTITLSIAGGDTQNESTTSPNVLAGADLEDITPPVTDILLDGQHDSKGFYTGEVKVTLDAQDPGTGVYATYFSLDMGNTWQTYSQPFTVEASQIAFIQARSMDLRGNQETNWAIKSLNGTQLFLSLIVQ